MIGELNKAMTISKNNAGFPDYLDFNRLRTEGIGYLGKLSGKIWTDHNVHDPGITILEVLCYALLDLGYRTNLPVADILAQDPTATGPENNFFTPAQILTNNPLTILDYRKLLVDIPGIRNAWLVPARDIKDICRMQPKEPGREAASSSSSRTQTSGARTTCEEFLNGIYHVYIETEIDVEKEFRHEDPAVEEADKKAFTDKIIGDVRKVLMAHRNLCEDFEDIYILCKIDAGVCATIDLEEGAQVEDVFLAVANRLWAFFSPSPSFYTLEQMLAKGKAMDDIFAGRPYSQQSHGFVDTSELEAIKLRREIHTSDIYDAIFEVPGVRKLSRLKFRTCGKSCFSVDGVKNTEWVFHLPQHHVPVFSLSCSGIEFTMNGLPVNFDAASFYSQLEMGWQQQGKVQYKMPSPYLDAALPTGKFHPDLGFHYSIQNDFPVVYGIGEGHMPDDVSDQRKAQIMQLRGYLMFFDQLLANYLSQLGNIRQLFSLQHPAAPAQMHTYFLNTITSIPEMDKLLRFGQTNALAPAGSVLAIPVDKGSWDTTAFATQTGATILAGFNSVQFPGIFEVHTAIDLLRNDLVNETETSIAVEETMDNKWLYAIRSSTDDFVMVGNTLFNSRNEAELHASSVQYAGMFEKNYKSLATGVTQYSFNIALNLITYTDYLGLLVEDEAMYQKRRMGFLSHLLSRFAEQFSDFVIYHWKSVMGVSDISAAEAYLTDYPDLSRNRGRAYNYQLDGLVDDNISGFEKKVKAIAGLTAGKKNLLCHFVVDRFDETYFMDPALTMPKGVSPTKLNIGKNVNVNVNEKGGFIYRLVDKENVPAVFSLAFNDNNSALAKRVELSVATLKQLNRMPIVDTGADPYKEVSPGKYSILITLTNVQGIGSPITLFLGKEVYGSKEEVKSVFSKKLIDIMGAAMDISSYGTVIISGNQPPAPDTLASIPAQALTQLVAAYGAGWVAPLVKQLQMFPYRKIDITYAQYAELYCKDPQLLGWPVDDPGDRFKWYFNLPVEDDISGSWISTRHFDHPEEMFKAFAFFSMLVNYAGNLYADCACTGFFKEDHIVHHFSTKLFIREVLAQGIDIFPTAEDAWGPKGIEKFICAVQGARAFWPYQRKEHCHSFYVTCGQGQVYHPCQYENAKYGEKVLEHLVETGIKYIKDRSYFFNASTGELYGGNGETFARVDLEKVPAADRCDLMVNIASFISSGTGKTSYSANSGLLMQVFPDGLSIRSAASRQGLTPEEQEAWIKEWEQELKQWACFFPIVRTKLPKTADGKDHYTYCIEIRLPGFNDCAGGSKRKNELCAVAWKSNCCYASCVEAAVALLSIWKELVEKNSYRLVYNCEDKTWGIAIHSYAPAFVGANQASTGSDIIALNPQCYTGWDEDCEAIQRAERLVNIQGLHLVEHILLRPVHQEDCRCRKKLAACGVDCDFPDWVETDADCVEKELHACFKPGSDPYSFIATVFLPGWSKRFRDEKERLLLERLMYREAPAHVLLRIIWLRPVDLCRLESGMLEWQRWLAGMRTCNTDFSLCVFLELLINRYYECMPACTDCLPCSDNKPPVQHCWDEKDKILRPTGFVDLVNALYCFEDYCRRMDDRKQVADPYIGMNSPVKRVKNAAGKKAKTKTSKEK